MSEMDVDSEGGFVFFYQLFAIDSSRLARAQTITGCDIFTDRDIFLHWATKRTHHSES
jgi:hypothetical protein